MSNVLDQSTQQQILALGRLGWTLSRIQTATGVRRETVSGYLKAAGIAVRGRGRPGALAKPAMSVAPVSTAVPDGSTTTIEFGSEIIPCQGSDLQEAFLCQ